MDHKERQSLIMRTSLLGIIVNLLLAAMKIIIGMAASSLAIISEGINNASDVGTSLLTLIGTKLSTKTPDEKHPFGYGRVEYLTSLVIAGFILYTGITLLIESIQSVFHPSEMSVNFISIAIVAVSAVVKFVMGIYTMKVGNKTESDSLVAVGEDCRNDSIFSIVTIAVTFIYIFWHISLDAYAGILFAAVIIKAGYDTLMETVNKLLGSAGKEDLAKELYSIIRKTDGVINAADMMLHDYGPDAYSGSVNIEMDYKLTVGEVYQIIHDLQLRIMHEHHVTMVFGIYAMDNDHEEIKEMRTRIVNFVRNHEHVKSYHALYIEAGSDKIYCDLVVDYEIKDYDALREEFLAYLNEFYPGRPVELVIETEFV